MHGANGIKIRTALVVALLLFALYPHSVSRAQPPPPPPLDRSERIEGLDNPYPREHGPHLSRPWPAPRALEMTTAMSSLVTIFSQYPTSRDVVHFLWQLHSDCPRLVNVIKVGEPWRGRSITAVCFGNEAAGSLDQQPALHVDGQHHARLRSQWQ
jgi:hypothetical protein